jgi:hypothetical protein
MDFDDANRLFGEMIKGLGVRYDLGSERGEVGRLVGDRVIKRGDRESTLFEIMQDGVGVLLDASTDGKPSRLVAAGTQRIHCVAVDHGPSLLIRPDACIAWAGDGNSTEGLREALRRWFNPMLGDASQLQSAE